MTEEINNEVKEELLENISELFLKYGLRSTSMDDICSHLKISKKTLYQFFSNKDDVVEQVMLHRRENHRTRKNLEKLKRHNPVEMIMIIKDHLIADLNGQMPANLFDLKKYHPEVYERINDQNNAFVHELLCEMLDRGIHDGFFRKDIDREVQIYLFGKQMYFLAEPEMISEIKYSVGIIISTIIENMIRALATPKGVQELEKLINK